MSSSNSSTSGGGCSKIAERLRALKVAALKKQQDLKDIESDAAFGRELMRLHQIKELEKEVKAKKEQLQEAKIKAASDSDNSKENDIAKEKELHEARMEPFRFKKVKPDGYYKYWIES